METTAQQSKRMMPPRRVRRGVTASDLPLRPRFLSEIVVAPLENGIVADGSGRLVVLEGNATKALIPKLMRLMDGTRTVDQLYSELHTVPEQDVTAAISVLKHSGLVSDCAAIDYEDTSVNPDSLSFMERFIGVTNDARNGIETYSRLQSSSIVLISAGRSTKDTERIAKLLEGTGAGCVTCLTVESSSQLKSNIEKLPDNALVIVLSVTPEDRRLGLLVDSCCKQLRLSWLRAGLSECGTSFDIGPLFGGRQMPCYSCFLAAHSNAPSSELPPPPPMTVLEAEFWLGLVASEIVFHRTRIGDCLTAARFRRYSLAADSSQALTVCRMPGCKRCCPIPGLSGEEIDRQSIPTALIYEDYIAVQQRPAGDNTAKEIQPGRLAVLQEATRQIKELPYSEHIPLTRSLPNLEHSLLDLLRCECSVASRTLGQEELGQVLIMSVGIRRFGRSSGMIKRWGATGGNLGSVEAFVAVNRVSGLQPGLYFYQARDHSLARLNDYLTSVADFIAAATGVVGDKPDAVIILAGAYHRLSRKYGPFAYKLMNFDAGMAASQLGLVGSGLGISVHQLSAWDDHAIEKRLRLEPFEEQVTNVLVLSSKDDRADTSWRNAASTLFRCDDSTLSSQEDFCGDSVEAVTKRLYRESRLQRTFGSELFKSSKGMFRGGSNTTVVATFPDVVEGGRTLGEVLSHRASVRHYTEDPVSLMQLAGMVASAYDGGRHDSLDESEDLPLQFLVLASRVEGITPGAYLYDRSENGLCRWRSDYMPGRQEELFIQEEFSDAPLSIWVFGPLAAACEKHGAFGHRQLMLRAGAAVHRCWMAALCLGMQGCPVAGIVPGAARELLGLDGYIEAPLLAFTAGHTSFEQLRQPRMAGRNMP
jgi:SagB-type dehydrogenase family enzyme